MMQYAISGGQLIIDKKAFTKELLLPDSPIKKFLKVADIPDSRQPGIVKSENIVIINYNDASDIILDENYYELFRKIKAKYREKIKGNVVIRMTAYSTYHIVLDLNSDDERITNG